MSHRIIVCDDEPHIVRAISLKFTRAGFDVHGAPDAETAWELLRREPSAMLITDYTMPGMNGADLVRRVRADAPDAVRAACPSCRTRMSPPLRLRASFSKTEAGFLSSVSNPRLVQLAS